MQMFVQDFVGEYERYRRRRTEMTARFE